MLLKAGWREDQETTGDAGGGKMSGWREVIRGGKTEKPLLRECKGGGGDGREKQRMTYSGEIRAWRDERYLQKKGWDDGVRLGRSRGENIKERERNLT